MAPLLTLSRLIDRISEWIGRWVAWLVLAAVLISAANAVSRKAFNISSNAYLEIQWYLFAAVFLLAAGYTLLRQEHVKIDVVSGRFSKRTQIWIEIFGIACFLLPFVLRGHQAVGCRWSVKAYVIRRDVVERRRPDPLAGVSLMPLGFALLRLQGDLGADQADRVPAGLIADPTPRSRGGRRAEEELAEDSCCRSEAAAREAAQLGGQT